MRGRVWKVSFWILGIGWGTMMMRMSARRGRRTRMRGGGWGVFVTRRTGSYSSSREEDQAGRHRPVARRALTVFHVQADAIPTSFASDANPTWGVLPWPIFTSSNSRSSSIPAPTVSSQTSNRGSRLTDTPTPHDQDLPLQCYFGSLFSHGRVRFLSLRRGLLRGLTSKERGRIVQVYR